MFWTRTTRTPELPRFAGGGREAALEVVRHPRARRMKLAVDPRDGAVRLTLPKRAALRPGLDWAESKRDWIEAQLAAIPARAAIVPGIRLSVGGCDLVLDWRAEWPRAPRIAGEELRIGGPRETLEARLLRWLKAEAKRLLDAETREIAATAGLRVATVGIGDPRSRWGSCASSGAIRYSWRLILAPDFVRRATVAHEVAHVRHMDHSAEFHAYVAELLGTDPKPARRWLAKHGAELQAFGR